MNRAISVRQPWAWLIVNGYKDIENRVWGLKKETQLGETFIHASLKFDIIAYHWVQKYFPDIRMPQPEDFDLGGIVGKVWITGSYQSDAGCVATSPWCMNVGHAWTLERGQPLPFMACKGRLKFFNVDYWAIYRELENKLLAVDAGQPGGDHTAETKYHFEEGKLVIDEVKITKADNR